MLISLQKIPRSGIARSLVGCVFSFSSSTKQFSIGWMIYTLVAVYGSPGVPHPCQHLVLSAHDVCSRPAC